MLFSCWGKGYRGSLPYYMRKQIYFPVFLSRNKLSTAIPKLFEVFLLWRRQTCKALHPVPPAHLHSPEWTLPSDFPLLLPWPFLWHSRDPAALSDPVLDWTWPLWSPLWSLLRHSSDAQRLARAWPLENLCCSVLVCSSRMSITRRSEQLLVFMFTQPCVSEL